MANPLSTHEAEGGAPAFDRIRPEHAEAAIDQVVSQSRAGLHAMLSAVDASAQRLTQDRVVREFEELCERLARAWGPVDHLWCVASTAEWRAAHDACLPMAIECQMDLSQGAEILSAYQTPEASPSSAGSSPSQDRAIGRPPSEFRLSGVALSPEGKRRLRQIAIELGRLQSKFQENVIDSVQAWSKHAVGEAELAGMSAYARSTARAHAEAKNFDGLRLTLDHPSYEAVLRGADDRALRHELYESFTTRASDRGPLAGRFDNGPIIDEILALRHEQARLLGFPNYAEISKLADGARSADDVERFLLELNARVRPRAQAELEEVWKFAKARDSLKGFRPWDLSYYSERLKEHKLGFSEDEIRAYFPAPQVLRSMLALAEGLFGVRIEEGRDVATWHRDVTAYRLRDDHGASLGILFLDPYARDGKCDGAWTAVWGGLPRTRHAAELPAACVNSNVAPPLPGQPALLSLEEVRTIFREFGRGLDDLLRRVGHTAISGVGGVEVDLVEPPRQFMDHWCDDEAALAGIARHVQTGEALPSETIKKLIAARAFDRSLTMLRAIEWALFDLRVHRDYVPAGRSSQLRSHVLDTLAQARRQVSVLAPPPWDRMASSFLDGFGGRSSRSRVLDLLRESQGKELGIGDLRRPPLQPRG
jgi:oligopeptidase A